MNPPDTQIHRPQPVPEDNQVFGSAAPESTRVPPGPRRRGRPPGSRTRLVHGNVSADEFALLRAVAQGVDLTVAARQYLLWPGRAPERKALQDWLAQLLTRVASSAASLPAPEHPQALKALQRLQHGFASGTGASAALTGEHQHPGGTSGPSGVTLDAQTGQVLARAAQPVARAQPTAPAVTPPIPSLEEFASEFPEDFYSEAELQDLYQEAYGAQLAANAAKGEQLELRPQPRATEPQLAVGQELLDVDAELERPGERMQQLLEAIGWLEQRIARLPERGHLLQQWVRFTDRQRMALAHEGVVTLGNLVDWMALRGAQWYAALPGYGVTRAEGLRLWLARNGIVAAQGLQAPGGPERFAVERQAAAQDDDERSLVPLTALHWPAALDGSQGELRTFRPNTLGATNDREAVEAWFEQIRQRSPATQVAYQRAIERLVLWAVLEKRRALSSLTTPDLLEFKAFLANPPSHWVQQPGGSRLKFSQDWRPLKGPQKDKSLNQTLAAVSAMYGTWKESDYISSNPARNVAASTRKDVSMDVMRSFSDEHLEILARTFDKLGNGPAKRRLLAILRLLEGGGLRRAELEQARWSHLQQVRLDNKLTDKWKLQVLGKGNRVREVPIHAGALEALQAHREDRIALAAKGVLSRYGSVKPEDMPLIGVIDEKWISTQNRMLREAAAVQQLRPAVLGAGAAMRVGVGRKVSVNDDGGLSESAIYRVLKDFFKQCAREAGESPSDPNATFHKASTHWLRHTFAHHIMRVTDQNLPVAQALLGHKDITTTAIYVKADLAARMAAVEKIRGSV